jgi:hypothetical protein
MKGMNSSSDKGIGRLSNQIWINRGKANENETGLADKLRVDALILAEYTVATLPSGVLGDQAIVTDATTPTYLGALTGGGAVVTPVWNNGTIWVSR